MDHLQLKSLPFYAAPTQKETNRRNTLFLFGGVYRLVASANLVGTSGLNTLTTFIVHLLLFPDTNKELL